ncbi:MAG: RloB domain-containing protein [Betaproteobacteria bacterium]|nr:RloB domain-containing protein [Betaproteobacteria bacterium]
MGRSVNSLRRQAPRYKPQPTVLVICEDTKSGKRYLEDASRHFRVEVQVEITNCGRTDPRGIVAEALARQGKFDRIFCVIDRDTHPNFDEALVEAKRSPKVDVIASYPCFEFWLLLHYEYTTKPFTAAGNKSAAETLIERLRTHSGMGDYAKGSAQSIFQSLIGDKFEDARLRSPLVHQNAQECKDMNPSTRLHDLMDFFEELSKLQPI